MPLVSKNFSDIITFTRASSATFTGSNGLIQSTPQSKNLLLWTQEFDQASWFKVNAAVTANVTNAPDSSTTADKLVENTATGAHRVQQTFSIGSVSTVGSAYLKAAGRDWAYLRFDDASSTKFAYFNLSSGVVGTVDSGLTATITNEGNGWYRCSAVFASPVATVSGTFVIGSTTANSTSSNTGDGTSGIFIWGAQLEVGSTVTDYTKNDGGLFPPRFDYDPVTLAAKGLLIEEQRTNLLTYSEDFTNVAWGNANVTVTTNAISSPDGNTTADKFEATTTGLTNFSRATAITGSSATYSIYAKQGSGATDANLFALRNNTTATTIISGNLNYSTGVWTYSVGSSGVSVTNAGNGWWRIQLTATSGVTSGDLINVYACFTGGTETAGEFAYVWGAQLEAGSFATSYIPTVASQVTRAADVASVNTLSPWYNATEGTLYVEATAFAGTGGNRYYEFTDGTSANVIQAFAASATIHTEWTYVSGAPQAQLSSSGSPTSLTKIGAAYATNDFAASLNGAAPATDTSGSIPSVNKLMLGSSAAGSAQLCGHLRRITYYPRRLSNAELQAITA